MLLLNLYVKLIMESFFTSKFVVLFFFGGYSERYLFQFTNYNENNITFLVFTDGYK